MPSPLTNSVFSGLLAGSQEDTSLPLQILGGSLGSSFPSSAALAKQHVVVFDFEATSLDTQSARIIEMGAVKFAGTQEVDRFSTLVDPGCPLSPDVERITGITGEMLTGAPTAATALPRFHEFLRGCVCVAHNAEYDCGVLVSESLRLGIECDYHVLCTLKMARAFVQCEGGKGLSNLARHFELEFEARHRSIGDALVTAQVLWRMLAANKQLVTMEDFEPFRQSMEPKVKRRNRGKRL